MSAMFLICGRDHLMHTEGVDELEDEHGTATWFVRLECRRCDAHVGTVGKPDEAIRLVDRLMWSDDARHVLDRLPPYLSPLVRQEVEDFARASDRRVITMALLGQARNGGAVVWDSEAELRMERVPAPVRAMARMELERAALDRGLPTVTVSLMEEVKARYFGMFSSNE